MVLRVVRALAQLPGGERTARGSERDTAGLRVAAAKIPRAGGYALSFAIVNDSDTPQSITLSVPSAMGPLTLAQYDYFDGESPTDSQGFPVPARISPDTWLARGLRVALPSRGVVVLSFGRCRQPVRPGNLGRAE